MKKSFVKLEPSGVEKNVTHVMITVLNVKKKLNNVLNVNLDGTSKMMILANSIFNVLNMNSGTDRNVKSATIPVKPVQKKITNAQVAMMVPTSSKKKTSAKKLSAKNTSSSKKMNAKNVLTSAKNAIKKPINALNAKTNKSSKTISVKTSNVRSMNSGTKIKKHVITVTVIVRNVIRKLITVLNVKKDGIFWMIALVKNFSNVKATSILLQKESNVLDANLNVKLAKKLDSNVPVAKKDGNSLKKLTDVLKSNVMMVNTKMETTVRNAMTTAKSAKKKPTIAKNAKPNSN